MSLYILTYPQFWGAGEAGIFPTSLETFDPKHIRYQMQLGPSRTPPSLTPATCYWASEPRALAAPLIGGDLRAAGPTELETLPFPPSPSRCPEETMASPLVESFCLLRPPKCCVTLVT